MGPRVRINGKEYDYFCGTSYYCLHGDPRIIEAACRATQQYGLGPATSWDVPPLREVETLAAAFFGTTHAHYFVTAYLGTFYLLTALQDEFDIIFVDDKSHYSVFDGIKGIGKPVVLFAHLDPEDLARKLQKCLTVRKVPIIVTDGVFPMTGAMAPLQDYQAVLQKYDKYLLCVDDSHGVGVLGANGRGSCELHGLTGENVYFCGTMSKAFGSFGGIIPGDAILMEKISRNVRVTLGASPPPVPAAAAAAAGIKILSKEPELRAMLTHNVAYLRAKLRAIGLPVENSPVPIINLHSLPSVDLAAVQRFLEEQGIMVRYIPPRGYSDAPDSDAIKITIFAQHTTEQLDRLIEALSKAL